MSYKLASLILALGLSLAASPAATARAAEPNALPSGAPPNERRTPATAPATAPALPQTPGFHHLFYMGKLNGQPRKLAYVLYLPRKYDPNRPCPMVLYLCGVGERGDNHEGVYGNGPPLSLRADKALAEWAPLAVLAPQCPVDVRWDMPGVPQLVLDLADMAKRSLAVDADRVYLTGLSMGGAGVWQTALLGKGLFAVVAPFCAIEVAADKMADSVRGETVWIICGGADGGYTEGSRKMFKTLRDAKVDVIYTEVPGQQHGVWPPFYASRQFYEFLLLHARGRKPATSRPAEEKLLAIAYTPPNSADALLAAPFARFLPWWYLANCNKENSPGLKDELLGRKNVFVTVPLDRAVPCRLLYTAAIPKDKKTTLALAVAAHPQGQWELVVRADSNELLRRTILGEQVDRPATQPSTAGSSGPSTRPSSQPNAPGATQPAGAQGPWVEVSLDLSNLAAEEVHLELVNRGTASLHAEAYWGKVELTSRDIELPKPARQPGASDAAGGSADPLRQLGVFLVVTACLILYELNRLGRRIFRRST